jgi:cytochrome b
MVSLELLRWDSPDLLTTILNTAASHTRVGLFVTFLLLVWLGFGINYLLQQFFFFFYD